MTTHYFEGHTHVPACVVYVPTMKRFEEAIEEYAKTPHVSMICLDPELCKQYESVSIASKEQIKRENKRKAYNDKYRL